MSRRLSLLCALLLLVSLADAASASGGRRRASGSPDRIEGVLTAVSADQLTVRTARDERQVNLTPSTVVSLNGQKTTANVLRAGDKVEIHLNKSAGGTLTAIKIEVDNDMDVSGVVKSISPTDITITTKEGDAMFTLTADTAVLLHGVRVTPAALATGMRVEIHWFAGVADARVARLIEVHTDLVETEGIVTAVAAGSITVQPRKGDAVTIAVTPDTVVRMAHSQVGSGTIAAGSMVEVKSVRNSDNTLTAVLIQVENPNDLMEIRGEVTAVGAGSITVKTRSGDEITLVVNAETLVRVDDRTAAIADVQAGSIVEIEATSDGTTLTAIRIKVERPDDRFVEVNGTVSEITGSLVTVQTKNGPVTVSLTSTTTFRGGSAADLTPGAVVEIMAARNTDGSLVALNVEIDDGRDDVNNDKLIEIQGAIVTIGPSSITLMTRAGKTVVGIDGATAVQNHGKAGTLGDLASGQMVEVKAQRNRDNTLLAKFIKIDD